MKGQHEFLKQRDRGTICFCIDGLTVSRLNSLEIPRRELITKEFVSRHQRFGDTVPREIVLKFHDCRAELRLHPIDRNSCRIWLFCRIGNLPALHQTECVPDLVVEVAPLFAQRLVEEDVVTRRSGKHDTHAHPIGTVLVDKGERIG